MSPFGLLPLHMGSLHAFEQALVYLLAFGPFLLLAAVIWIRRRHDDREDSASALGGPPEAPDHSASH